MKKENDEWDIYTTYGYIKKDVPFSKDMTVGTKHETIANPYSGVKVKLNPIEVAVYDTLMGSYNMHLAIGDKNIEQARELYNQFNIGKNWFIDNNPQAYFDLID